MVATSPGYSITLRVSIAVGQSATSDLVAAAAATGAGVTGLDVVESTPHTVIIDVSADTRDVAHAQEVDRKSTRLNSSHVAISYAVFCLKKNGGAAEDHVALRSVGVER